MKRFVRKGSAYLSNYQKNAGDVEMPASIDPSTLMNDFVVGRYGLYKPKFRTFRVTTASTQEVFYIVPPGKKFIATSGIMYNPTAGSIRVYPAVRDTSGNYHTMWGNTPGAGIWYNALTSGGLNNSGYWFITSILHPGEGLGHVSWTTGLVLTISGFEVNENIPLKAAKIRGLVAGNNLVYKCPYGKQAVILESAVGQNVSMFGYYRYSNVNTGVNPVIKWYVVPNGQQPSINFQLHDPISIVGDSTSGLSMPISLLSEGDEVILNSSIATMGNAWINVMEFDKPY